MSLVAAPAADVSVSVAASSETTAGCPPDDVVPPTAVPGDEVRLESWEPTGSPDGGVCDDWSTVTPDAAVVESTVVSSSVPASPVVVVMTTSVAGSSAAACMNRMPFACRAGSVTEAGSIAAVGAATGASGAAGSAGAPAAACVGGSASFGRLSGVPIESLTTGTFANGSFAFGAAFEVEPRTACTSFTTGTRVWTTLRVAARGAAACAGLAAAAGCASGGSGATRCTFGTRRYGKSTAGTLSAGSGSGAAATAGMRKAAAIGPT